MKAKLLREFSEEEWIDYKNSPLYNKAISHYQLHPTYLEYQKEYFGPSFMDYSIIVYEENKFFIALYLFSNSTTLSLYGAPSFIVENFQDLNDEFKAYDFLYQKIADLSKEGLCRLSIRHNDKLYSRFGSSIVQPISFVEEGIILLTKSKEMIKMSVRKSYKSLINSGYKNLDIIKYDSLNISEEIMNEFRDFHIQVAKRKTRSDKSWELQYQAVKQGCGFVLMGYKDQELVACSLVIEGQSEAYYGVGVYNRDLMAQKIPLSHAMVLEAIYVAKDRGLKKFVIGDVSSHEDQKLDDISKFKRGFVSSIELIPSYTISLV